ncbi:MAG: signal recognition particle-docking protein FtsY [Anaerovoracaceae bacterium]|jgi:fused signal recognition particle receptor|nr:signal recognition particle-docking protein FtsY [Anaerovoracaceae bacterium]
MSFREKKGFFGRLTEKLADVINVRPEIDEEMFDDIEEVLITSDIGMETTMKIVEETRTLVKKEYCTLRSDVQNVLERVMVRIVDKGERHKLCEETPLVVLMIGINGGGKTTTIGKLAHLEKKNGKSVVLAAADTFRAAAGEQLKIWGDRNEVNVITHDEGTDPAAVIFDGVASAKARGTDVLICDTAGRLQNKKNLMAELEKMNKVIDREFPEAHRETLLVLDATTGKNAVSQAKEFNEVAELTGVILTKLDGTAKGGIAITIADEFDLPIKYIGTGEGIEDLEEFVPADFIGGIFHE